MRDVRLEVLHALAGQAEGLAAHQAGDEGEPPLPRREQARPREVGQARERQAAHVFEAARDPQPGVRQEEQRQRDHRDCGARERPVQGRHVREDERHDRGSDYPIRHRWSRRGFW